MAKCRDIKVGRLLHLYELNLLDADDRELFEIHLLECGACYQELSESQSLTDSLKHDLEVKRHVAHLLSISEENIRDSAVQAPQKKARSLLLRPRTIAVAAGLILILLLQPWRLNISVDDSAYAEVDRLAVFKFEDQGIGDKYPLGKIIASLLSSDLSESHYIHVVPLQRLNDIISLLGEDERKMTEQDIMRAVASRAEADWIVTGTISAGDSAMVIVIKLTEVPEEEEIVEYRAELNSESEVFSIADELSEVLKSNLRLPEAAKQEPDRHIADITTYSAAAYAFYVEGIDALSEYYYNEALVAFEKALAEDSTFAMAYYHLSALKEASLIERAASFSENASRREQMYIQARLALYQNKDQTFIDTMNAIIRNYPDDKEAPYILGSYYLSRQDYASAIEELNRALQVYPRFKLAFNDLAYSWDGLGEFDSAMKYIDDYIALVPDEPNPYDSRGEIYALNGHLDMAIESYKKALDIKPDFVGATTKLGNLYMFKRDYDMAGHYYQQAHSFRGDAKTIEMFDNAVILMSQGYFQRTMSFFSSELLKRDQDSAALRESWVVPRIHFLIALMLEETEPERAVAHLEQVLFRYGGLVLAEGISLDAYYAGLLARNGRLTEADSVVKALRESRNGNGIDINRNFARALTAYYRGQYSTAAELLAENCDIRSQRNDVLFHYYLATVLLALQESDQAAAILEQQLNVYSRYRLMLPMLNVKIHFLLGQAYERAGKVDLAVEQYRLFLETWNSADENIESIIAARDKLTELTAD